MNNEQTAPHDILKQIVTRFGKQIFNRSESARLEALLSDYFTDDKAKLRLFRLAISQNIAHGLLQADTLDKAAKTIRINMLKTKFQSENFLEAAIAREIVVCFAFALGWNIVPQQTRVTPLPVEKENPPAVKQPVNEKTEVKQLPKITNEQWKNYEIFRESGIGYGYKDENEKIVIPAQFLMAKPFHEGFAAVAEAWDKWGFIDATGAKICRCKYSSVEPFSEGLAAVKFNDYWGFIDYSGELVIPLKYESVAESFINGEARVREKGKDSYYIDKSGNYLRKW